MVANAVELWKKMERREERGSTGFTIGTPDLILGKEKWVAREIS